MPRMQNGKTPSNCRDWRTPQEMFHALDDEFHFDLDAAADAENALCDYYFDKKTDALDCLWSGRVFLNPPYGREIDRWVAMAHLEVAAGNCELVVALLPASTDTRWWQCHVTSATEVRFVAGRVRFGIPGRLVAPAPFASAIVIWVRNALGLCRTSYGYAPWKE